MTTPNIGLIELSNSAGNYLLANESFAIIDALLGKVVKDKDLNAPPSSPDNGDVYIIGTSPTGLWAGHANKITFYSSVAGAWVVITPKEGWKFEPVDEDQVYRFDGADWSVFAGGGSVPIQDEGSTAVASPSAINFTGSGVTVSDVDGVATVDIPGGGGGGASGDLVADLVNTEVSITGAITLTGSAFGKLHVCSGTSADYTVTLPAASGNAGKLIGFRMAPGLTKFVTLDANAAELIDAAQDRVMWANEVAILLCDGSAWTKIAGKTIPLSCGMYPATLVSVSSATPAAVPLDTVIIDNSGGMADAVGDRINIRRPANYRINAMTYFQDGANTANVIQCIVNKNGSFGGIGASTYWPTIQAADGFQQRYQDDAMGLIAGDYLTLSANQSGGTRNLYVNNPTYTFLKVTEVPKW